MYFAKEELDDDVEDPEEDVVDDAVGGIFGLGPGPLRRVGTRHVSGKRRVNECLTIVWRTLIRVVCGGWAGML